MNDEELLEALARVSREASSVERSRLDHLWSALSSGELTDDEEQQLQELAASSPEHARKLEAFYPLDDGFRAGVVARLTGEVDAEQGSRQAGHTAPRRAWLGLPLRLALPALTLAVLVLVMILPLRSPDPLPAYQAELEGGARELRGDEPTSPPAAFVDGSVMRLILRPESAVEGRLEIRCLLIGDGAVEELMLPVEIAETGAVRIRAELGRDLVLEPGSWALVTVIGRRGRTPGLDELRELVLSQDPGRAEHWLASRVPFLVVGAPRDTFEVER